MLFFSPSRIKHNSMQKQQLCVLACVRVHVSACVSSPSCVFARRARPRPEACPVAVGASKSAVVPPERAAVIARCCCHWPCCWLGLPKQVLKQLLTRSRGWAAQHYGSLLFIARERENSCDKNSCNETEKKKPVFEDEARRYIRYCSQLSKYLFIEARPFWA